MRFFFLPSFLPLFFSSNLVRVAHDGRLRHGAVRHQGGLDLGRADAVARCVKHLMKE